MNDLSDYLLGQVLHRLQSIDSELSAIRHKLDELITWGQRLALLAASWIAAIGLNLDPDKAGAAFAALLKSFR